jgi:hypothetical protein
MTDKPTRRRRLLLVPLLGMGVAAWVVRSKLVERPPLREGWPPLPARPVRPAPAAPEAEPRQGAAASAPPSEGAAEPAAPRAEPEPAPAPEAVDEPAPALPGAVDEPARALPEGAAEPVPARARAVPAAAAVASVAAPALPDAPYGPGSVRANDDGSAPEADYVVKGKTATRVFYAPGSPYYSRTRADVWFRTDDDARAAGFIPRAPRKP